MQCECNEFGTVINIENNDIQNTQQTCKSSWKPSEPWEPENCLLEWFSDFILDTGGGWISSAIGIPIVFCVNYNV